MEDHTQQTNNSIQKDSSQSETNHAVVDATGQSSTQPVTTPFPPEPDEIFLTPRVIDQTAFGEFSGQLRTLIDNASEIMTQLQGVVSEAGDTSTEMKKTATRHQERLSLGARLLQTVSQEVERAEKSAKNVNDRTDHLEELEALAQDKTEVFQTQLDEVAAKFTKGVAEKRNQLDQQYENLSKAIDTRIEHWDTLPDRMDVLSEQLQDHIDHLVEPAKKQLTELIYTFSQMLGFDIAKPHGLDITLDDCIEESDGITADNNGACHVQMPMDLRSMVALVNAARNDAAHATEEANQIKDQWDQAREALADEVLQAADATDQMQETTKRMETQSTGLVKSWDDAFLQTSEEYTDLSESVHDNIAEANTELENKVAGLTDVEKRVSNLLTQLNERQREIDEVLLLQADAETSLRSTLKLLEPWQMLLDETNDAENTGQVPQRIEDILATVRQVVSQQFADLGNQLSHIAQTATRQADAIQCADNKQEPMVQSEIDDKEDEIAVPETVVVCKRKTQANKKQT